MSNTRDFKSPGVFAADATTVIPPTPTLGVAYRDTTTTVDQAEAGWPYGTKVESDTFNQIMFQMSSMLDMLDRQGVLGWSNAVTYSPGALAIGSDGKLYKALATTVNVDPTSGALATWVPYGASAASVAEVQAGAVADKYVSPATLLTGLLGAANLAASGVARIPVNVGGVRLLLVVMWGGGSAGNGANISFPEAFPNACFRVIGSDSNGREIFGSVGRSQTGFSLRTSAGGLLQFDYIAIGW